MLNLLNWYLLLAQPHLWCKCYDLLLHYALLHLSSVLNDFGGVRIPYSCTTSNGAWTLGASPSLFRTLTCSNHKTLCFIWFVGSSRLLISFVEMFRTISSLCNLWILNIVWFPLLIHHWICLFDSTHILRNAHLFEELILYWPSK